MVAVLAWFCFMYMYVHISRNPWVQVSLFVDILTAIVVVSKLVLADMVNCT